MSLKSLSSLIYGEKEFLVFYSIKTHPNLVLQNITRENHPELGR